ncbi:unnamed protein product [Adineta steineri]|uniref:Uncharacterized protein n=1 Tax=Adineta steineri TaxID=433720 RepID=A0A814FAG3_9BILA|nr:unnamed protein product [Adineta steineri]CAF1077115.1 unnamed protein product [Adineta steineri]CAF1438818.1 unnamed protein product [Adineta steineri]
MSIDPDDSEYYEIFVSSVRNNMRDNYLLFILRSKANRNNSSIKCRISETHLFSLLKLMKTILYSQTFDQKQRKQNQIDIILLCALLDLTYYTGEFLHILFKITEASPFQTNQQQQKDKDTSCDESSFLSSILQKHNEYSIECKTDFTLHASQILILTNSYSNKIILIDLAKLQMNTYSMKIHFYQILKIDNTQQEEGQIGTKHIKSSKCITKKQDFQKDANVYAKFGLYNNYITQDEDSNFLYLIIQLIEINFDLLSNSTFIIKYCSKKTSSSIINRHFNVQQNTLISGHPKQIINVFNNLTYFMKISSFIYFPLNLSKHSVSSNIKIHTNDEPCLIAFCERLCFEMTTDLDETRLQVFFLSINVYVEDSIVVSIFKN